MRSNFSFFGSNQPAIDWFSVTPDDNNDLSTVPRYVWVGGAGDLEITSVNGNTVIIVGVTAGTMLPIQPTRIKSTNTTATNIVALK